MYMTVRETLELPPLQELDLLGGASGLDRRVTRVSVLEVPETGTWSRGGELFMSTLYALRADFEGQRTVVRNMARNQAAALCLHPGLHGPEFLSELAKEADDAEFPLLLMPRDMPYAVVTDAVMGGLLGRQAALIQRSAAIHREFIQLTLRGEGLDALCRAVSRRMQRPVVVVSSDGLEVMADSGPGSPGGQQLNGLLRYLSKFSHQRNRISEPIQPVLDTGGPDHVLKTSVASPFGTIVQVAAPVIADEEIAAYLVTWELDRRLTEFDVSVLAHACTAVGLVVLRRRAVLETEQRIRQDFYGTALSGKFRSPEEARLRAEACNVRPAERYLIAAMPMTGSVPQPVLEALRHWPESVAVPAGNIRALVLHVPPGEASPLQRGRDLLEQAIRRIGRVDAEYRVGIGQPVTGFMEFPMALQQATTALSMVEQIACDSGIVAWEDLGVFGLLGQVREPGLLSNYASEILEPLTALRSGDDLTRTLEAFLDHDGSYLAASRSLGVHPNTVKYRMERIRAVLGEDVLADAHKRLGLHLALKARRVASYTPPRA